jgi:hypothetical protein
MNSVTDVVKMYGVRKIGKNVPHKYPTYFIDEAESWMESEEDEIVLIEITPIVTKENYHGK